MDKVTLIALAVLFSAFCVGFFIGEMVGVAIGQNKRKD